MYLFSKKIYIVEIFMPSNFSGKVTTPRMKVELEIVEWNIKMVSLKCDRDMLRNINDDWLSSEILPL